MRVFEKVIDEGRFSKAAHALRMAPAAVTRHIADLENHLQTRLIQRTTRHMALTDAGELYLDRVRQILRDIEDVESLVSESSTRPSGIVRLLAPSSFAVRHIAPLLPLLHLQCPGIELELTVEHNVEAVDTRHDVCIVEEKHGALVGDFILRRLATSEIILCASPEYVAKHGEPQHPHELSRLPECLVWIPHGIPPQVQRRNSPSEMLSEEIVGIEPSAALRTQNMEAALAAIRAGFGVAAMPSYLVFDDLRRGELQWLLPQWRLQSVPIHAAIANRRFLPGRTRALLDFLKRALGGSDLDHWLFP